MVKIKHKKKSTYKPQIYKFKAPTIRVVRQTTDRTYFAEKERSKIRLNKFLLTLCIVVLLSSWIVYTILSDCELIYGNRLKKLGKDFYSNFYYQKLSEHYKNEGIRNVLADHNIGYKITLKNLNEYNSENYNTQKEVSKIVNPRTRTQCDLDNTYIIIKPNEPYGKDDLKVVYLNIDCDLE